MAEMNRILAEGENSMQALSRVQLPAPSISGELKARRKQRAFFEVVHSPISESLCILQPLKILCRRIPGNCCSKLT